MWKGQSGLPGDSRESWRNGIASLVGRKTGGDPKRVLPRTGPNDQAAARVREKGHATYRRHRCPWMRRVTVGRGEGARQLAFDFAIPRKKRPDS